MVMSYFGSKKRCTELLKMLSVSSRAYILTNSNNLPAFLVNLDVDDDAINILKTEKEHITEL